MSKKVIVFDLDDTLSVSKSLISDRVATLLPQLATKYQICIISGGKFEQFETQVIDRIDASADILCTFHMMPTCGTRYYCYSPAQSTWELQYAEDLTSAQKKEIIEVLEDEASKIDLKNPETWGPIIEDRQSQVSYSILGQKAPPEEKYKWADKNLEIKKQFHARVSERLTDLEVRMGGSTTIDITKLGIDKAYGIKKLMEVLSVEKSDLLFVGDRLEEGGNDYPVKAMGVDCVAVNKWEDTALIIEALIKL